MSIHPRLITIAAAAALSIAAPIAIASTANAAVTGYSATVQYIGGGDSINVRQAPSLTAAVVRRVSPGTGLSIECQAVGDRLGFSTYADNRTWDRLSDGTYVHDVLTTTPGGARTYPSDGGYLAYSSSIPRCSTAASAPAPAAAAPVSTRESKAVDFALGQVGVTNTSLTPDGVWSGWCELFAERAYGTSGRYASASADYQAQLAVGAIHTDTNPPVGALVFYRWGSYGHVGISLGGGQVVSTQGYLTPAAVRRHTVTGIGLDYLGWSAAPASWSGR